MKRYLATLLALVLLFTGLAAVASAAEQPGMYWNEDGGYYYVKADGTRVNNGWYYISDGSGAWWDKQWVYGESSGYLKDGWLQDGGTWYYLWPEMMTGGYYDFDEAKLYILSENGALVKTVTQPGWVKVGNDWYYAQTAYNETYDPDTDEYIIDVNNTWLELATWCTTRIDGKMYAFDKHGRMMTGWAQPFKDDSQLYYSRAWYYAKPDGSLAEGWMKIDGDWYYFEEGGRMKDMGATLIDGKRYVLDYRSGKMVANQWYRDIWIDWETEEIMTGSWLYLGPDGAAKTGWFKDGNTWYYANEYGDMLTGWLKDGGVWYYLQESGAMATGWQQFGDEWCYFKASGAQAENEWLLDGNAWYWLKADGTMAANETLTIGGVNYSFAANGVWIPN